MKQYYDLAVIGAGPAGMAAATQAAELGLTTALIDEQPEPGGQIYRKIESSPIADKNILGPEYYSGSSLAKDMRNSTIDYIPQAEVWEVTAQGEISLNLPTGTSQLQAGRVILATGAMERPFPITGWTKPGVMSAGAAQILLKSTGLAADGAVFAGTGPLLYLIAAQLIEANVKISALLDTTPNSNYLRAIPHLPRALRASHHLTKGLGLIARIRRAGVPIVNGVTDLEVLGGDKVSSIRYQKKGTWKSLETDHVFLHQGVIPNTNLAMSAGCEHVWDDQQLCWHAVVDTWGTSSNERISISGDSSAIAGAVAAECRGRLAALEVAHNLNAISIKQRDEAASSIHKTLSREQAVRPFLNVLYRPLQHYRIPAKADTVVCRCEEVTVSEIDSAISQGCSGPNQLKVFTRCGMGPCQGRMCSSTVSEIFSNRTGLSVSSIGSYRVRAPIKPLSLGQLGNMEVIETPVKTLESD